MRVLPLALWHDGPDEALVRDAHLQSMPTQAHPRSSSHVRLTVSLHAVISGARGPLVVGVQRLIEICAVWPEHQARKVFLIELHVLRQFQKTDQPRGTGYVLDTIRSARNAMEEESFEDAVRTAVLFGCDTDATAAVAAGLAGIKFGFAGIPLRWLQQLRSSDLVEPLIWDLAARPNHAAFELQRLQRQRRGGNMTVTFIGIPSIEKGLTENTVLWRYLDMAKFLDLLQNSTLYFCRGDRFADKYEGAFTDSLKHAIDEAFQKNQIDLSVADFKNLLRQRVFVNCWHASSDDSMAMWSLYGKSAAAVAITTTVGKLRDAISDAKLPHAINIVKVKYVKHWRDPELVFKPYSNVFAYKLKAYDYEREVRVVIDRFHEYFDANALPVGMSAVVSLPVLLRSIVVSPEAAPWFVKLVKSVVEKYGVPTTVNRSKLAYDPE